MTYPWNMDRCFNPVWSRQAVWRSPIKSSGRSVARCGRCLWGPKKRCGHWVIDPRYISNSCWFHLENGDMPWVPIRIPWKNLGFWWFWWLITVFGEVKQGCLFIGHIYFCWKPIHFLIHIALLYIPLQFHYNPIIHLAHHRGTATCVLVSDAVVLRQVS